jgi:hypothetical protein
MKMTTLSRVTVTSEKPWATRTRTWTPINMENYASIDAELTLLYWRAIEHLAALERARRQAALGAGICLVCLLVTIAITLWWSP